MGELGAFGKDIESIWSQLKHEEKHLTLKRRWLMGLADSKSDPQQLDKPKFLNYRAVPESLLREDDIFYETVKDFVQKAYDACDLKSRPYFSFDNGQLFDASSIEKLLSGLDDMTSKGLLLLAMTLNRGSVNFDKSRTKMKKIIRDLLPRVLRKCDTCGQVDILKQLSQLLCNPHNFKKKHGIFLTFISLYHRNAAYKILDGLQGMHFDPLLAMYRKLRGLQFDIKNLMPKKSGWSRKALIKQVKVACQKMLSELGNGDSLQDPLAKALAVAGLSLKLTRGSQELSFTEFYQYSPEIKNLQDEIARAILILNQKVRFDKLKELQHLLDPDAKITNRSLRTAIRKILVNFLFECDDMREVPKYLLDALAFVNKSSKSVPSRCLSQEDFDEDVECILGVSAQAKQVVWDMLPGLSFDRDFDDAYMEDSEESDGIGIYDNIDDDEEEASIMSSTATSTYNKNASHSSLTPEIRIICKSVDSSEHGNVAEMNPVHYNSAVSSQLQSSRFDVTSHEESTNKNQYLSIQEACDETSVFAYNLIGQLLHTFVQMEGLDVSGSESLYLSSKYSDQEECQDTSTTAKQCPLGKSMEGSVLMQLMEERMPFLSKR